MADAKPSPETAPSAPATPAPAEADAQAPELSAGSKLKQALKMPGFIKRIPRKLPTGSVFSEVSSEDLPTRQMARVFVLSFLGCFAIAIGAFYYWNTKPTGLPAVREFETTQNENFDELSKQNDAQIKAKSGILPLSTFTLELKPVTGVVATMGVLNLAEVDIVLQCASLQAREELQRRMVELRNEITQVFVPTDRSELLSKDGKKKLKKKILKRLGEWFPEAVVDEVYFTKILVH